MASVSRDNKLYSSYHTHTDLGVNYESMAASALFSVLCVKAAAVAEWSKALAALIRDTFLFLSECFAYTHIGALYTRLVLEGS